MALYEVLTAAGITLVLTFVLSVCLLLDRRRCYWVDKPIPSTGRTGLLIGDYGAVGYGEHMVDTHQRLYRVFKSRKVPIGGVLRYMMPSVMLIDPNLIARVLLKDAELFTPLERPNARIDSSLASKFVRMLEAAEKFSRHLAKQANEGPMSLEIKRTSVSIMAAAIDECLSTSGNVAEIERLGWEYLNQGLVKETWHKYLKPALVANEVHAGKHHLHQQLEHLIQNSASDNWNIFTAGFQVATMAMVHCLHELANDRAIQDRLRAAILDAGHLTLDKITRIEYLNMVIEETFRKYPSMDHIALVANCNYRVPRTDLIIPKRMSLILPTNAILHDGDFVPRPERFDPERFSTNDGNGKFPGPLQSVLSDASGTVGFLLTQIGLIAVLRHLRLSRSQGGKIALDISPRLTIPGPAGGVTLLVEKL